MALGLTVLLVGAASCTSRPDDPEFDNPLDPALGGDPFELKALFRGSDVFLTWNSPGEQFTHEVFRSPSIDGEFVRVGQVAASIAPIITYADTDFVPYETNYYRIRVVDAEGNRTAANLGTAAVIAAELSIATNSGSASVASRMVTLLVRSGVGDEIELAPNADFSGSTIFPLVDPVQSIDWDLGSAAANGDTLRVHGRARDTGVSLGAAVLPLVTAFTPMVSIDGTTRTGPMIDSVADTTLQVRVDTMGVTQLRFATTRTALALASWMPPDTTFTVNVTNQEDPAPLLAEFESDFGYSFVDSVSLIPATLETATFQIAEAVDSVVVTTEITLIPIAPGAGYMAFSEDPAFVGASWLPLAATTSFTLSPAAGKKTIYGQFSHPWAPVPQLAVVEVTLVGTPGQ